MSLPTLSTPVSEAASEPVSLVPISEACRRLHTSRSHFYELAAANQIAIRKLGAASRVRSDDLDRLIESLPAISVTARERR